MYQVLFSVNADTGHGEVVCVTGNCAELGNWDPDKAVELQKQGDTTVWSKELQISSQKESVKYRYFIAHLFPSKDNKGKATFVQMWETSIKPREVSQENVTKNVDIFGQIGSSKKHLTRGCLIEQSQINLSFHDNPIEIWNTKYKNKTFSIKCEPIDHRFRDEHLVEDGEHLPQAANSIVLISVLEKGRSTPQAQGEYGAKYTPNCYMSFLIQTLEPKTTGFRLHFYVYDGSGEENVPRPLGYAFILPLDIVHSVNTRTVPINNPNHKPIGQIKFEYMVVKPMAGNKCDMSVSYQKYWNDSREPLDVGHRGMGMSYHGNEMLATIPENTVKSLVEAANHGADFVEFDVHLTKDKEVIVYHDFKVKITYKKTKNSKYGLLEVPVKDLKLSELQQMKLWHKPRPENPDEINSEEDLHADNADYETFPTLERCFNAVDNHTGFNIELKYPQELQSGTHEQEGYYDINEFIDTLLRVVFEHHGGRRIVFSTFDCDTCIALQLKQNRYPVLFLTQADTTSYEAYGDIRTRSVPIAVEFCIAHDLLGVNPMSQVLLNDETSLIDDVKNSGLVLFTWGEDNNNAVNIEKLKKRKVDAIIYDRIDIFKSTKESIFKPEHKKKLKKNHDQFPSTIDLESPGTSAQNN